MAKSKSIQHDKLTSKKQTIQKKKLNEKKFSEQEEDLFNDSNVDTRMIKKIKLRG